MFVPLFKPKLSFFAMLCLQAAFLVYFTILIYSSHGPRQGEAIAKRNLYTSGDDENLKNNDGNYPGRFQQTMREFDDLGPSETDEYRSTRDSEATSSRDSSHKHLFANLINTDQAKDIEDKPSLFVAILSANNYTDRRQAVRESWMQECDPRRRVVCKFFTDGLDERGDPINQDRLDALNEESIKNRNDLVVIDTPSGINFSLRMLALMEWAKKNVVFDFLLRIDDDYFLCLDRLIEELPLRPRKRLYWGYLHCIEGITRIDEGMMILSADLVDEFIRDKDKLLCHKFGDQAVAMWIYDSMKIKPVTWFGDKRIHHDPPASFIYNFKKREEICHTFLSLHGTYPRDMAAFQGIADQERRKLGSVYDVSPVTDTCPYDRSTFYWNRLRGVYYARPVPCRDEPTWVHSVSKYNGRENFIFVKS